jgi:alpha-galactosidase
VTVFKYEGYEIVEGKRGLPGLPATYGDRSSASTLLVHLKDEVADLSATLSYAVFPAHNAIVRSFSAKNHGVSPL